MTKNPPPELLTTVGRDSTEGPEADLSDKEHRKKVTV